MPFRDIFNDNFRGIFDDIFGLGGRSSGGQPTSQPQTPIDPPLQTETIENAILIGNVAIQIENTIVQIEAPE